MTPEIVPVPDPIPDPIPFRGASPAPSAEEADMSVHRTTLHRRDRVVRQRPDAPVEAPSSSLMRRLFTRLESDRGDVPGWVLITLMTAGIVVELWAVASEQIVQIFENAMAPFLGGSL